MLFVKKTRRRKRRYESLTYTRNYRLFHHILQHAAYWDDEELSSAILHATDTNTPITYHHGCKMDYNYINLKKNRSADGEWHKKRAQRKAALEVVIHFVQDCVVNNKNVCTLSFLHSLYKETLSNLIDKRIDTELIYTDRLYSSLKKV